MMMSTTHKEEDLKLCLVNSIVRGLLVPRANMQTGFLMQNTSLGGQSSCLGSSYLGGKMLVLGGKMLVPCKQSMLFVDGI
jgi:hypothetical protein